MGTSSLFGIDILKEALSDSSIPCTDWTALPMLTKHAQLADLYPGSKPNLTQAPGLEAKKAV